MEHLLPIASETDTVDIVIYLWSGSTDTILATNSHNIRVTVIENDPEDGPDIITLLADREVPQEIAREEIDLAIKKAKDDDEARKADGEK